MADSNVFPLCISSFNCRGLNDTKKYFINRFLHSQHIDIMFLQEHWWSESQLNNLSFIHPDYSAHGISGFDKSELLLGRPYGGCAIMWKSTLCATVCPLTVDSKRVCAVRVSTVSWSLLLINVYMPYESEEINTEEFICILSLIDDLIATNTEDHIVVGGDFNVDFGRDWVHTAVLRGFCDNVGLCPAIKHPFCNIDYSYNFNMSRFSVVDHFLLSGTLSELCVNSVCVVHDVDNLSDHEPIILKLDLDTQYLSFRKRAFKANISWAKANECDISNYANNLSCNLINMSVPTAALLCLDQHCKLPDHHNMLCKYAADITCACLGAGEVSIPVATPRVVSKSIPGWGEHVEPLRQKSMFWHSLWIDSGRPRSGVVADCMRRSRAKYHYAIRDVKRNADNIVRERVAEALIADPSRDFWREIRKIRCAKTGYSRIVDGCADELGISRLFTAKYQDLFTSVPYDADDLRDLLSIVSSSLDNSATGCLIGLRDVLSAISKLKPHKNDGNGGVTSDHFIHAGPDLSVHISLLFTGMLVHGCVPQDFLSSTIIPIPKKSHVNVAASDNYRGIALSSLFGKLFDNVILLKYSDKLNTSRLQFGFKHGSSTNMCTMVLKETISYYMSNNSPVYCTFLDASKAFDRVHFCKLFRLLMQRGLPMCVVRLLINFYVGHFISVSWAGFISGGFVALNGVKQGGVLSPVLFCIYIDLLLSRLSCLGVGCYIGFDFVGALAYADDIVLVTPTPFAMRKMLATCDRFAVEFNIIFNAQKSNFLVFVPPNHRFLRSSMISCAFYVGGKRIEYATSYSHLGHIICCDGTDREDIINRRNIFIGQVNNVICCFDKLTWPIRLKLFKSYCTSLFGCELWSLDDDGDVELFCVAWRKCLRRILRLPYDTHSSLLPLLSDTLPIYAELCKRTVRFIASCLRSSSCLVRSVAHHSIINYSCFSVMRSNLLACCKRFSWHVADFVTGKICLNNSYFASFCRNSTTQSELRDALFVLEVLSLRETSFELSSNLSLTSDEFNSLISFLCTH